MLGLRVTPSMSRLRPLPAAVFFGAMVASTNTAAAQAMRTTERVSVASSAVATVTPRSVLETVGGVPVFDGGYGSSMALDPARSGWFYLMTDRGPNFDAATEGQKVFVRPAFAPHIGVFHLAGDRLQLDRVIEIKNSSGQPLNGIPNQGHGATGETPMDSLGHVLPFAPEGIDPEGLAAMRDGSFWVAEEYGPSLLHLAANGNTIERINPFSLGRALPAVFAKRRPNRGIEGLAVTPDQRTLVGIMEGPLDNPKPAGRASRIARIVTFDIGSGQTRQFVYLLENAGLTNKDITALSDHQFLVIERDDQFPGDSVNPSRIKRIYRIDLGGATDVSDPANGETGRMFEGKTLEELAPPELATSGIVTVTKSLVVDLLDPGLRYPHNKPEGIVVIDQHTIAVSNDDDFGIDSDGRGGLKPKVAPMQGQTENNTVQFIHVVEPLF
jgi:hypothetical protein